jgi:hypothetical protein
MRSRCSCGGNRTGPVIPIELLDPEDPGAAAVLRLFDLRSVDLHLVADSDAGGIAFQRVGFPVTRLQLKPVGAGHHASGHDVMAAADLDGNNDGHGDHSACGDPDANDLARSWTDVALALRRCCRSRAEQNG